MVHHYSHLTQQCSNSSIVRTDNRLESIVAHSVKLVKQTGTDFYIRIIITSKIRRDKVVVMHSIHKSIQ